MIRGDEMKLIVAGGKFVSTATRKTAWQALRVVWSSKCRTLSLLLQHLKETCLEFITRCSTRILEALNGEERGKKSCHNNTAWLLHPMRGSPPQKKQRCFRLNGLRCCKDTGEDEEEGIKITHKCEGERVPKSLQHNIPAEGHGSGGHNYRPVALRETLGTRRHF